MDLVTTGGSQGADPDWQWRLLYSKSQTILILYEYRCRYWTSSEWVGEPTGEYGKKPPASCAGTPTTVSALSDLDILLKLES